MTTANATGFGSNIKWSKFKPLFYILLGFYGISVAGLEGNSFVWWGVAFGIAFTVALFIITDDFDSDKREKSSRLLIVGPLLIVAASFVHLQGSEKVWIVDGETTMSSSFLLTYPSSDYAQGISVDQSSSFRTSPAKTKDGASLRARISGSFRLTENEQMLIGIARGNNRTERGVERTIERALMEALDKSFAKIIATKELSEINNNLVLEFNTGSLPDLEKIGVKRNGEIKISDLHVQFVD